MLLSLAFRVASRLFLAACRSASIASLATIRSCSMRAASSRRLLWAEHKGSGGAAPVSSDRLPPPPPPFPAGTVEQPSRPLPTC